MTELLTPSARILARVASLLGARVTSGYRTVAENDAVGGSPVSEHLTGNAIDIGIDASPFAVSLLTLLAAPGGGRHQKGTAPHYHFVADSGTALRLLALGGLVSGVSFTIFDGRK